MDIEIKTYEKSLVFEILGKRSASIQDSVYIPGDAKLIYNGSLICKSIGIPETINFTITFGSGVAAGVVANWIYDKLKDKTKEIYINKVKIELEKERIKRIIEESIKIRKYGHFFLIWNIISAYGCLSLSVLFNTGLLN